LAGALAGQHAALSRLPRACGAWVSDLNSGLSHEMRNEVQ